MRHGALLAGAPEHEYNALYDFGGNLGLAFQLQDDYLDVYGDVAEFGKNIGGDIVANKKTYMLIKALELADPKTKEELWGWIEKKQFDHKEKIEAVTRIYDRLGIKEVAFAAIDKYLKLSRDILDKIEVPRERKVDFYEILDALGNRKK